MYINYSDAEKLFKMYPTLQSILESLQMSLDSIAKGEEIDDTIYTLIMGNKRLEGTVPTIGNVSDTTGNLATRIQISERISSKELTKDILKLSMIIQKVNLAMRNFSKNQTAILKMHYWEGKTWQQVAKGITPRLSVSTAKNERKSGINKIVGIALITYDDFKWVIELIDGKEEGG